MNYLSPLSPKSGQSNRPVQINKHEKSLAEHLATSFSLFEDVMRSVVEYKFTQVTHLYIRELYTRCWKKKKKLLNLSKLNENSLFKNVNINRYRTVDLREKTQEDSTCSDCLQH